MVMKLLDKFHHLETKHRKTNNPVAKKEIERQIKELEIKSKQVIKK